MPDQLIGKPQRQIGHGTDVDRDDAKLLRAIQLDRVTEQAKACIVDDVFDLHPRGGQGRSNQLAGIGLFEIAGDHDRLGRAATSDFLRQRRQAVRAPRNQSETMAFRCKNARQFGAYSRRGTGNQRHTLGHDSMLLNYSGYADNASEKAYALGGMQATCKHDGVLKRTICSQNDDISGPIAWPRAIIREIKFVMSCAHIRGLPSVRPATWHIAAPPHVSAAGSPPVAWPPRDA